MLEPIGDKVFIRVREDSFTESGLVLPESAVPTRFLGDVVYVGPNVKQVKPGDVVVLNPILRAYSTPVVAGGESLLSTAEVQILGILRDEAVRPVSA